jgi:O-antigen/teichoic acid export membrane protein
MQFIWFFFHNRQIAPTLDSIYLSKIKTLFTVGIKFSILQISSMLLIVFDNFLIAHYYSTAHAADFNIAYRLYTILITPIQAFAVSYLPAINEAYFKQDQSWITKSNNKTLQLILAISIVLSLFYILFAEVISQVWISSNVSLPLGLILAMGIFIIISNLQDFINPIMMSPRNLSFLFQSYTLMTIINIIIKFLLIDNMEYYYLIFINICTIAFLFLIPSVFYLKTKSKFL